METATLLWDKDSICLQLSASDTVAVARQVYLRTCRTDFDMPGFCLVRVMDVEDSVSFRKRMVALQQAMLEVHQSQADDTLIYLSAARFDQQESTKPHLDGGPAECFLMLGYEPSEVRSELEIIDYAKCAFDMGISPSEFMSRHNPMFRSGYDLLRPYATVIPCFTATDYQIVCINNSSATHSSDGLKWQGTLHTATILMPDESKRRVINSTMIGRAPRGTQGLVDERSICNFTQTSEVRRRGYDKSHLDDDQ
jgi:hypothetical protein